MRPTTKAHLLVCAHGNDFTFKITLGSAPFALIDDELPEAKIASVLVRFGDDPGRRIRDAEVENLANTNHIVEGVHEFGD